MRLIMPTPHHFNFQECLWFLDRNYDDVLHKIEGNSVLKLLRLEGKMVLLKVSENEGNLCVEVQNAVRVPEQLLREYVADWFDLDRDLAPFYALIQKDKQLVFMAEKYRGLRLLGIPDLYEALCWSIIGQQINLTFAYTLKRRLVENYGQSFSENGYSYHLFPEPEILQHVTVEELKNIQFSKQKAEYIIGVSRLFANGSLSKEMLQSLSDQEAREKLLAVKGIGIWTANYAMMKSLKRLTAIPFGDVGLHNALIRLKQFEKPIQKEKVEIFFQDFPGWEAYLVFYLWRSLTNNFQN